MKKNFLHFLTSIKSFSGILILNLFLIIISRITEFALLFIYQNPAHLYKFIFIGIASDIFLFTLALTTLFQLHFLLKGISIHFSFSFILILTGIFWTLHFIILSYYITEFRVLDVFLFQYSWKEISLTIFTSGAHWWLWSLLLILPALTILIFHKKILKFKYSIKYFIALILLSIPGYIYLNKYSKNHDHQKIIENKSVYFYVQSCKYLFHNDSENEFNSKSIKAYQKLFNEVEYLSDEYPLLHHSSKANPLGPYFEHSETAPNIVILIVEGLNNRFVKEFNGISFMPFLDSLKFQSLYWDHFLTNGERSFAVVPSLLGSLPFGKKGFTFLDPSPVHLDLVNNLNSNQYFTSFFYGQGAWMHEKDRFFKRSEIDLICDNNKFQAKYHKIITGNDHYFWGYNDISLFSQYATISDTLPQVKRFDIIFTGSTHPPFAIDNENSYKLKFQQLQSSSKDKNLKRYFNTYQKQFISLMFADDAIRSFFKNFKSHKAFKNTIFIITGDHPMTEIPIENSLKRYHVPFIIYSTLVKQPVIFHGVGSHLDFYEPFLALLNQNFGLKVPELSSALSSTISTSADFDSNKKIAFMKDNRTIIDFFQDGYFLSNGKDLYKVHEGFELTKITNSKLFDQIRGNLKLFRVVNQYSSLSDKLIPDSLFFPQLGKQILYKFNNFQIRASSQEYIELMPEITIPDISVIVDFSFEFFANNTNNLPIGVYQLKTKKDSLILWQSFQIVGDKPVSQYKINILKTNFQNDSVKFQLFFWNQKKIKFEVKNLKLYITR